MYDIYICRVPEVDPYQSTIGTAMLYQKSIDFWYSLAILTMSIAVPIVDWDNHSFLRVMYQNSTCTKSPLWKWQLIQWTVLNMHLSQTDFYSEHII